MKRLFLFSLVISFGIWGCFSWPLPRYFSSGVPAAAHMEPVSVQPMVPGDHLQFMYYCWLAGDMLFGKTPLFCNPYEFNTGETAAKSSEIPAAKRLGAKEGYSPDSYYFPFSLVYAVSASAGGRALGWNLTGFLTLWSTYLLTWLLVRRYASPDWLAGCAALIAIALSFRWINLCGGSPAGWACVWIPAILLGIDLAIRDGSVAGGLLAGISILFASWTDQHIFFFGTLASPAWAMVAFTAGARPSARLRISWQNIFLALLPIPLFVGAALAFPVLMQQIAEAGGGAGKHLSASVGSRGWREVALYSPLAQGLISWLPLGVSNHIYIGFSALSFLAAGFVCLAIGAARRQGGNPRQLLILCLLLSGIAAVVILALGVHGPWQALFLRACRKLIPPYAMIRQPAKIFCLMPVLLSVAAGIGLSGIFSCFKNQRTKILLALLFCAAVVTEYKLRVHPTICILDLKQGAYEAVIQDAAISGKQAHAMIVPLWPGDAADSSIYQYYASLYRLRMLNGYSPVVPKSYAENVFNRYESVNQGLLTEKQVNGLLRSGINYLILHEDLFPEKVSPFPVGMTLKRLLENERLKLVKQAGRAWAFKLENEKSQTNFNDLIADQRTDKQKDWQIFGSAWHWPAASSARKAKIVSSASPAGDSYVTLDKPGAAVCLPLQRRIAPDPQMQWMARVRGEGTLYVEALAAGRTICCDMLDIESDDWTWINIPAGNFREFSPIGLKIEHESGSIDCDEITLAAQDFSVLDDLDEIFLPAKCMFHAGYTSLRDDAVVFEKVRERCGLIFYGPKLPLEKGKYIVELVFGSAAPRGALLGQFNVKRNERDPMLRWIPVVSGARSMAEFSVYQNLPMRIEFQFLGNGDMKISGIKLIRLE